MFCAASTFTDRALGIKKDPFRVLTNRYCHLKRRVAASLWLSAPHVLALTHLPESRCLLIPRWWWGLLLLEAARLLLWCPVYESHMICHHVQAGALLAVVLISAGLLTARHGHLLFSVLLDDVREVFSMTPEHCHRVPGRARILPLLSLLIEPAMRLSSTKRKTRLAILRELQASDFADICSKTDLCQFLVLLNLCCTIPANTDPCFFLLILR